MGLFRKKKKKFNTLPTPGQNVVLIEGSKRGFLSNYITILTSFRDLIGRNGISADKIFISPSMFSLYGHPNNWFDDAKILENPQALQYNTIYSCDFGGWPTIEQLNLNDYCTFFPYNNRTKQYLADNLKNLSKTIGVHYRGTDHRHTDRVDIATYLSAIESEFKTGKFEQIYVATDEEGILEKIQDYFWKKHQFDKIVFNNTLKSSGSTGLHLTPHDDATRIILGDQVLLDVHSIANCDVVIGKSSNITNYARILNMQLNVKYQDLASQFRINS